MLAGEILECCKSYLGEPDSISEDHNDDKNTDSKDQAHFVIKTIGNWTTDHTYLILAKCLSAFMSVS